MLRGVLFDWRGTLVADPPDEWWVTTALDRLGRDTADVDALVGSLRSASLLPGVVEAERSLDCSAALHRAGTMSWFREAGLDDELATMLYSLDFEPESHPFFPDVADTLKTLQSRGIATAVVSDVHFDLRPEFEAAGLGDLIDAFVLSFEHGVQKPDAEIFRIAAESLSLDPQDLLMVGDRASHDGGAVALGITTLLVPPLPSAERPRDLHVVLAMCDGAPDART